MSATEGYVLIAIGKRYEKLVENFFETLRHCGDQRSVYAITEPDKDELYRSAKTDFERNGTIPKITLDRNLPFDHTIFLDADVLCAADTQHVWDYFRSNSQPIQCFGTEKEIDRFWLSSDEQYRKDLGFTIPKIHSGLMYFNRNELDPRFFSYMRDDVFPNFDSICHNHPPGFAYKGSRPDQEIYSIAMGKFGYHIPEIWEQNCITILKDSCDLPITKPWFKYKHGNEGNDIPFLHIFNTGSDHYRTMHTKILNS